MFTTSCQHPLTTRPQLLCTPTSTGFLTHPLERQQQTSRCGRVTVVHQSPSDAHTLQLPVDPCRLQALLPITGSLPPVTEQARVYLRRTVSHRLQKSQIRKRS